MRRKDLHMIRERAPCVYILSSQPRGTLYIGVASDLVARLWQHRNGTFDGFTKRHDVKRLVWFEMHATMEAAILREKQLKNWRRQWKLNLVEAANPHWADLAIELGFAPIAPHTARHGP